ncbi:hypothetical protein Tco_0400827 [Tanacetum coccineum]
MLESEAYMTYHAYATGEKTPKPKTTKKKVDSESSPKTKSTQASKGKRIMTLAKGDKPAKKWQSTTKSKGLTVLSEVALIERSKIQTHSSHAIGSGDGVDIQSKVPDEQQQNISGTNEGAGDEPEVFDVPSYRSESEEESWTYSQGEDDEDNDEHDNENDNDDEDDDQENEEEKEDEKANDDDEVSSDQKVSTLPDYEMTEEEENQEDDDVMGGEKEDEEDKELYGDLNLNLDRRDIEMINAQINQEKEETPSSNTTIPQTPILIIQPQQQTHDSATTTTIPTTTLPEIPNFASLFGFKRRVSSLETELSKLKQTNQFAEAVSSILVIVDNYLASKMKDAVNVAFQLQSNKLREEAQAKNDEFLKQIDSNIKAIIKD